jgi:hypothetical protein
MLPTIALGVIVAFVALGPLVLFVPRLAALRRRGILEYGILGQLVRIMARVTKKLKSSTLSPQANRI